MQLKGLIIEVLQEYGLSPKILTLLVYLALAGFVHLINWTSSCSDRMPFIP